MKAILSACAFLLLIQFAVIADWAQFLGPNRDGTIKDETLVKGWLGDKLSEKWRVPIGEGYSGIVVNDNSLFSMDSNGNDEFVFSLSTINGKEQWRVRTGSSPRDVYGGYGPRVTPSLDGNSLFTVSAEGDLIALRQDNGQILWKRQLLKDLGWRPPAEGTSSSPLVSDGRIYLIIGGSEGKAVAAFDRNNGKTIWTSQDDRTSYSSAMRWDFERKPQVLFLTGSNLFSVDSGSGKLLWKYSWPTYDFVNVATPILIPPDRVFISSGYDQGAALLRVHQTGEALNVKEIWRNREMKNHFSNSVYYSGVIYGFDNAIFKAIAADSGQTLWREKGFGTGSVILAGSYLIILSDSGELLLAKANRQELLVKKRIQVLLGKSWTPPSISTSNIYLRNHTEAVCLAIN
jgi:outer membrane protein assembly factor BamB